MAFALVIGALVMGALVMGALAPGCAATATLPGLAVTPAPSGWVTVTQEPLFSLEMPGRPEVTVEHEGFLTAKDAHLLSVTRGDLAFQVMYMVPAAGWDTPNLGTIRDEMLRQLIGSRGVHLASQRRSPDGRTATGTLLIDADSEFGTLPEPALMRFLVLVLPDCAVLLMADSPREVTARDRAMQDEFFHSLRDSPGRHPRRAAPPG